MIKQAELNRLYKNALWADEELSRTCSGIGITRWDKTDNLSVKRIRGKKYMADAALHNATILYRQQLKALPKIHE